MDGSYTNRGRVIPTHNSHPGRDNAKAGVLMPFSDEEALAEKPYLDIRMLGDLQVLLNNRFVEFISQKAKSLFSYLVVYHRTLHAREKLAELFWPNRFKSKQQNNFKTILWQIRQALQDQNLEEPYIYADRQLVGVYPLSKHLFQTDIDRFTQLIDSGFEQTSEKGIQLLEQATRLYRGDFLEGFYDDWCISIRENYWARYIDTIETLGDYYTHQKDYVQALSWRLKQWEADPWCEQTLKHLMILYEQQGCVNQALELYLKFAERLRARHGVNPQSDTTELYHKLRNQKDSSTVAAGL